MFSIIYVYREQGTKRWLLDFFILCPSSLILDKKSIRFQFNLYKHKSHLPWKNSRSCWTSDSSSIKYNWQLLQPPERIIERRLNEINITSFKQWLGYNKCSKDAINTINTTTLKTLHALLNIEASLTDKGKRRVIYPNHLLISTT